MYVVAKELIGIPGLPGTEKGMRQALKRLSGNDQSVTRKRQGTKAIEYHIDCLPENIRQQLVERQTQQLVKQASELFAVTTKHRVTARDEVGIMEQCPAVVEQALHQLTDAQKAIASARILLAVEVHTLREHAGMTRTGAIDWIVQGSRTGNLPPRVLEAASVANARQGKRVGVGKSSLQDWYSTWLLAQGDANRLLVLLSAGHHKAVPWQQIPWLDDFFAFYRVWQRPSVAEAYRDFEKWWREVYAGNGGMLAAIPGIHTVRHEMQKVPKIVRERYRTTGSAWRSLNPFKRRDWSQMPVNAVWVGDGHCMKMQTFNPLTNNVFQAEVTFVMDAGQRFIVGWSIALSENTIAVADALRHAISQHGVPLIYYSDNGPGETGKNLDADVVGMLPRLGIEHFTGIPGNPQGRGIIERFNKNVPREVARQFESYCHKGADEETVKLQQRIAASALKAAYEGKELTPRQVKALGKIPTWEQTVSAIEREVELYNNRDHSSLPRRENGRHYSPAAYRRHLIREQGQDVMIDHLTPEELHEMFRPEEIRTTTRGEIRIFNNIYFSTELKFFTGEKVRVNYDIHDANSIIVRRMDGSFICDAIWNGNKVDGFAKPVIQKLTEERVKGRIDRGMKRVEDARRELRPALAHQEDEALTDLLARADKEAVLISQRKAEIKSGQLKTGTHN
ncbi:DDE-type integrase/transposase/recombinase [Salmonella enterica]|uniref:Transposase n=1 Tax=Salmonella enterica I TaxID=59201 RepID=A0A3R0XJF3_SALET|nr:transposase [Salmonella enterica subsp. enterica serovar Oranienburg]EHB1586936.1 DDE-type integrase/transposase/recombinase [Salmonella enterica]EED9397159.1 DDE-type integrase/transposase/recombinase [Salmonella enterica subsp. enterica serovar Oranienburg]EHC9332602.1 DDE-type integrase/transposase/recombinase [Salmonella enterica]ELG4931743.1 transposase [Salmonella enterica]